MRNSRARKNSTPALKPQEELKILHRVMEVVHSGLDLDLVLKKIVELVTGITKADSCLIYLIDQDTQKLVLRASKNPHPKIVGAISLKVGEGITGWVAKTQKTVTIARGAGEDPRFKFFHNLPEDTYEAFLSVPILHKSEVIGVMNIQHRKPHRHTPNFVALVSLIANQVGGAIENARLFEETRKKAMQLEKLAQISDSLTQDTYLDTILNSIVNVAAEMLNAKLCSILLLDEKNKELVLRATQTRSEAYKTKPAVRIQESVSGRVIQERRPIVVRDVKEEPNFRFKDLAQKEGLASLLSVPMRVKNQIIGVLNVYTADEHEFSKEEVDLMDMVADQVAVAIENSRLLEEAERARELLETRKVVEKAKGILMRKEGLSEDQAYKAIHKKSMDTSRPMKEIAEAIIVADEMGLGAGGG